ncbi:MAG: UDP-N-acetylmuramoyl-L-alanyl-D-glutamate--2,6-diaminopimelate ligase [Clostridia bacterium]|nr:UDP-N-acetylmuramoyl-L-alanyl-D-glutamate--2,6-diaminopimelate ligase [Clostridia bacterium]
MQLSEALALCDVREILGDASAEVTGVAYDSRRVRPGDLFVAVPGFRTNGHLYVQEAVARGASAVLAEQPVAAGGRPVALVADSRRALAWVAAQFYGHPSKTLRVVGVTGTNGKTTTTFLVHGILSRRLGTGLIGTVTNVVGARRLPVEHTTPESPDLQRMLRDMVEAGDRAVAMEVSSHALSLHRVETVEFDVGVFTNLSQDHLDFHGDLEHYIEAKALLFRALGQSYWGAPKEGPKGAVLNADDPVSGRMAEVTRVPVLRYGLEATADLRGRVLAMESGSTRVAVEGLFGRAELRLPLPGRFNVYNALAALGATCLLGVPLEEAVAALAEAPAVPGRFERIEGPQPFTVVVDYAHTPDGLENVLRTARELARGRVIVVFGAGGDRDRGKRPQMGAVAARWADLVVLTSDNPRSEEPEAILDEIEQGLAGTGAAYLRRADRRQAIREAIAAAAPGDLVLIAGKGHETYQIFRDRTIHFDDREEARAALADLGFAVAGPRGDHP